MTTEHKTGTQEAARWLRIGAMSLSVLSPFVRILAARVRAYAEAEEAEAAVRKAELKQQLLEIEQNNTTDEGLQDKWQVIKSNFNDVLSDISEKAPSVGELKHKGKAITNDLSIHRDKFSQAVLDRSNQISQGLTEQGNKFSQDWLSNSHKFRESAEQKRSFWIAFGFGVGLTGAAITTYVITRQRAAQRQIDQQDDLIQLRYDGNTPSKQTAGQPGGEIVSISQNGTVAHPVSRANSAFEAAAADKISTNNKPTDAKLIGVTSTMSYYPVETPLDQLQTQDEKPIDVIYFSSESEAEAQGFHAAGR